MHGIEQNPKLGYYKVGDQTFYSKPEALIYATDTDQLVAWHFNPGTYAKVNWTEEPESDIRELYRLRAVQLRDRYDYIRVEASGGGDSTTAIFAFLLNGIHLDEVVFRYPKQGEKGVSADPFTTSATNTLSEWDYAAKPLLDWIKTHHPAVKITVHDYSENMQESEIAKDESWVFTTRDWFQPGHGTKHTHFGTSEHKDLAESGKSICVLYGVDKPKVAIIDDGWYAYFIDLYANHPNPIVGDNTNITTELFYWTPDFPEISVKQVHMIRQWFNMPQNSHLRHLVNEQDPNKRTAYEFIAKSIIYPDYDLATWQTSKPTNSFYNEMDYWFYTNFKDTHLYDTWERGLQFLVDKIDKKYFYKHFEKPVGLVLNRSPYYYIGPAEQQVTSGIIKNRDYLQASAKSIVTIKDKRIEKKTI